MLFEFYKSKSATVPKQQNEKIETNKYGQISPTSAETYEPSTIAAIAENGASVTASKNLLADEMMPKNFQQQQQQPQQQQKVEQSGLASFHPRVKYILKNTPEPQAVEESKIGCLTAIPTSVLVANSKVPISTPQVPIIPTGLALNEPLDIKPIINPVTGLPIAPVTTITSTPNIKPQAAVIAEALLRNGFHNFQQQLRAQEILRQHAGNNVNAIGGAANGLNNDGISSNILENILRKQEKREQRNSECENELVSETASDDEEDEARYHGFEDIHLMENGTPKFNNNMSLPIFTKHNDSTGMLADPNAQNTRKFEYTMSEYGGSSNGGSISPSGIGLDGEPVYECRHCGKKYRWKSTLRRHENVECGGKEPAHQCPYCPYKSKQRGNLGVHVRKHHTDMPQLPSKRRSKYSPRLDGGNISGANNGGISGSDDSESKLIIDFNNSKQDGSQAY